MFLIYIGVAMKSQSCTRNIAQYSRVMADIHNMYFECFIISNGLV